MIARLVLPLLGLLLLGAGAWVIAEYPIEIGWFAFGFGDGVAPDLTPAISVLTQLGLVLLVLGGAVIGAAVGLAIGRRTAARAAGVDTAVTADSSGA